MFYLIFKFFEFKLLFKQLENTNFVYFADSREIHWNSAISRQQLHIKNNLF